MRRQAVIIALLSAVALQTAGATTKRPIFAERAAETGLDFHHFNGMSGELYFVEMAGPGVAVFDYDGDGDLDVFIPQGQMLGDKPLSAATLPPVNDDPLIGRLYRNDLEVTAKGQRRLHFTDVTKESGIIADGYGMGVATGDLDNDGDVDLYLTNFGANQLWLNQGDGTFEEVTRRPAVTETLWSVSASFADYDEDGWLDLYVGNYVNFTLANHKPCFMPNGARDYCGPLAYASEPDNLYHNRGDGTFEDVSATAGIAKKPGNALGIIAGDFDGDGDIGFYVANDQMVNFLWLNQGDGTFEERAILAGVAVNGAGIPEASMGVDAQDYDDDDDLDLFLTHLNGETNTLYVNQGGGAFLDRTLTSGLGPPSLPYTSFGTNWIDYDNDTHLDLLVVSGEVRIIDAQRRAGDPHPLKQNRQLFRNSGNGRYEEISARAGPAFQRAEVGRGAAFGDLDNDGDTDVVVANNAGPARLLLNQVGQSHSWLGLRLVDPRWHRDAIGAVASLELDDGRALTRRVHTDGSYASANDPRIVFGLADDRDPKAIRVRWPDGLVETFGPLETGRYHALQRGKGRPATAPAKP